MTETPDKPEYNPVEIPPLPFNPRDWVRRKDNTNIQGFFHGYFPASRDHEAHCVIVNPYNHQFISVFPDSLELAEPPYKTGDRVIIKKRQGQREIEIKAIVVRIAPKGDIVCKIVQEPLERVNPAWLRRISRMTRQEEYFYVRDWGKIRKI